MSEVPLYWQTVARSAHTALEATQGQTDGFFSQLPYNCHLEEAKRWHLWELELRVALNSTPGWRVVYTSSHLGIKHCLHPSLRTRRLR
jgi:starvation-inducible outer membrane lipoprotein